MAQKIDTSNIENDSAIDKQPVKPHGSTSTSKENKEVLPIPNALKQDGEHLVGALNQLLMGKLMQVTRYTSLIPNVYFSNSDEWNLQRYLIDRITLKVMKEANILNWFSTLQQLYPVRTSGNGNCLLHATLIAMIGLHDHNLILRDQLAQFMKANNDILKIRWRTERLKSDKMYGMQSTDAELDSEWNEVCDIVLYRNPDDGQTPSVLHFLEAVHIFSLSNMLRRPFIILSEDVIRSKTGEPISVNDLYGIYLPILSASSECNNEPIVLAYDRSHFCPLLAEDQQKTDDSMNYLPLYLSLNNVYDEKLLPIRFLGNEESIDFSKQLLQDYLRTKMITYKIDSTSLDLPVLCAKLGSKHLPLNDDLLILYHKYLKDFFNVQKPRAIEQERDRERNLSIYDANAYSKTSYNDELSVSPWSDNDQRAYTSKSNAAAVQRSKSPYSLNNNPNDGQYERYSMDTYSGKSVIMPKTSARSPDFGSLKQKDTNTYQDHYQNYRTSNFNNINNGKQFLSTQSNMQKENSLQRHVTEIPITVIKHEGLSASPNEVIYVTRCSICSKKMYNGVETICSECYRQSANPTTYYDVNSQVSSRPSSLNYSPYIHTPRIHNISPTRRRVSSINIRCQKCKSINIIRSFDSSKYCSACGTELSINL